MHEGERGERKRQWIYRACKECSSSFLSYSEERESVQSVIRLLCCIYLPSAGIVHSYGWESRLSDFFLHSISTTFLCTPFSPLFRSFWLHLPHSLPSQHDLSAAATTKNHNFTKNWEGKIKRFFSHPLLGPDAFRGAKDSQMFGGHITSWTARYLRVDL